MKIKTIDTETVTIPLKRTFKTAIRSVNELENVIVKIQTDQGTVGYGAAAPTALITGETTASIIGAVDHIAGAVEHMEMEQNEIIFQTLHHCIIGNTSAKAAVDMALYDLLAKFYGVPLYQLLGGNNRKMETDITIGLDSLEVMERETRGRLQEGFRILKVKVGGKPDEDINRLAAIAGAAGPDIRLRIDANQGWSPKDAVHVAEEIKQRRLPVELMEQPVAAGDLDGLRFVRENVHLPVWADESAFSPQDALKLVTQKCVDGINIKLMKSGGIYNALKILAIAESAGIPCMIGSMMESHLSVTAAAHLAAAKTVIQCLDLDAPLFCSRNPVEGGIRYRGAEVKLPEEPGLGIANIR